MVLLRHAVGSEPVGPLPAELLAEHGAHFHQAPITGSSLQGAGRRPLLIRVMDDEHVGIGLFVLFDQVVPADVIPETARLHPQHIDAGFSLYDPFRQLPAGAAGSGDAEAVALVEPEISQAPGRTHDGVAVRGVGDGAVVNLFDAALGKGRHPVHGRLDMGLQALDIFLEQFVLGAVAGPVQVTAGRALLVRTQDKALVFFPQVPGAVGFPQDGHFRQTPACPVRQIRVGLRHDVLVFDRHHRYVQTDHGAGAAGIVTGRRDYVFTGDITPGGLYPPLAGSGALYAFDQGVAVNDRAPRPGALCQGLGQVSRLDITVFGMKQRADQPVRVAQGPNLAYLLRCKEFGTYADGAGRGRVLVILVHAVPVHGQAQVAHLP